MLARQKPQTGIYTVDAEQMNSDNSAEEGRNDSHLRLSANSMLFIRSHYYDTVMPVTSIVMNIVRPSLKKKNTPRTISSAAMP